MMQQPARCRDGCAALLVLTATFALLSCARSAPERAKQDPVQEADAGAWGIKEYSPAGHATRDRERGHRHGRDPAKEGLRSRRDYADVVYLLCRTSRMHEAAAIGAGPFHNFLARGGIVSCASTTPL
jgi:hypothetical protein